MKKTIFAGVLSLSLLSGGTSFGLAAQPNLSEARSRLLETTLKICYISTRTTLDLCSKEDSPDTDKKQKKGNR
jgi:hypothetical protein